MIAPLTAALAGISPRFSGHTSGFKGELRYEDGLYKGSGATFTRYSDHGSGRKTTSVVTITPAAQGSDVSIRRVAKSTRKRPSGNVVTTANILVQGNPATGFRVVETSGSGAPRKTKSLHDMAVALINAALEGSKTKPAG